MPTKTGDDRSIPLYIRIKNDLRMRIEEGEWNPDTRIPSEASLSKEFGVSRITVLEALKGLVGEGLVYRKQGKGTFVAKPRLSQSLNRFYGLSDSLREKGIDLKRRILRAELQKANRLTARRLGIREGDQITEFVRLSLVDDEPFYLETITVPFELCPNLHLKDIAANSLNQVLTTEYKIPLVKAKECFEPIILSGYETQILGVADGTPALLLEHTTYTVKNNVVYFSTAIMRGDRCRYYTELE